MNNTTPKSLDSILELLKKQGLETDIEIKKRVTAIAQVYIDRGLYNSTARVSEQLKAALDIKRRLLVEEWRKSFQSAMNVPIDELKKTMREAVKHEYKKLIPMTNTWLVKAGLAQDYILESYKKKITDEMERAKKDAFIRYAIPQRKNFVSEVQSEKWYQSRAIQAALIGVAALVFVSIVGWLITVYVNKSGSGSHTSTVTSQHTDKVQNALHKPIRTSTSNVEVTIKSDEDFDGVHSNVRAYLAFMKGEKSLLKTSSIGYEVRQTGNGEVVYQGNLTMDAGDSAVGHPVSNLKDTDYILLMFGRMPPNSFVLRGRAICTINSVNLDFLIPQQKAENRYIFIRDIADSLQVLNESSSEEK